MFGEVVRGHRRRLGLTQEELATAAGLSVRSISKFESGRMAAPRMSTVRLLADVFGLAGTERERFCQVAVGVVSESGGAPSRAPAQLPPDIAVFAGRAQELEELDTMLAGAGSRTVLICAVSGPAGVGKTAMAVHWAHRLRGRYPDGQLYVNLRGYDPAGAAVPPGEAIRQVLDAFGVPARRVPADLDGRISLYRTVLAGKRVLVVLDNARDAQQVLPLLPGSVGAAHHATGDADRARDAWERALAVFERLHHPGADSVRLRLRHVDARSGPSDATELRGWWHPREDARGREVGAGSL